MSFEKEVELAKLVAQEAGALALDYQRHGVTAESKYDESPVTAADRACEKLIVETIGREFPEDGILGEEGANRESRSGRKWIVDPIDGTRDFVRGIPLWAVLIGLEQDGKLVAGAAHCPGQNALLWAARGSGAFANGSQIRVSGKTEARDAVLSFNGFHKAGIKPFADRLVPWLQTFWAVRSLGGAMDAILLAQGKADVWIEPNAAPWDLAPLKILIEEAGGVFRTFAGEDSIYGGNAYACTPALEPHIKELLKR
ncbi:MAG TPA: inositol monophosphatase [Bryobacteraceae bacterium]|jgi:histidinol phosphatase-like enzyme (inositol monophosphatase family)|nr:inositol monophosphatase [Bryobacteraceae bacterium]